ncbi:RING/U-box superfamily protein [Quillaja saponaria]|uniref:RING/U-box superfamily protein n=1 Tax=Quillaja saponaria TaxID=32244 RepID=A0AAD7PHP7_QUISA|nr:RING/U-box superfamily protein [Quillaja saponaria]
MGKRKTNLFRDEFDDSKFRLVLCEQLGSLQVSLEQEQQESVLETIISEAGSNDNILVMIREIVVQELRYGTMEMVFGIEMLTIDTGLDQMRIRTTECAICIAEFEVKGEAAKLPCLHVYHRDCISKWLQRNPSCPMCRFKLSSN